MAILNLLGETLHYIDQGSGEAVVLLHAFPLDSRMWEPLIETLSKQYRVIAPDFRGFGESSASEPFTIETLAEDVREMCSQLGLGSIVLAGLSMGGYVSLAYARKFSDTLRGLILMDTKADADTPEARGGRAKMIQLAEEKGSTAVVEAMLPKLLSLDALVNRPDLVQKVRDIAGTISPKSLQYALAAMRDRRDQSDLLAAIIVPTLIIVGDADAVTPPAEARAMQKRVRGAEFVIIQQAGHLTAMEQPEQTIMRLEQFLNGLIKR